MRRRRKNNQKKIVIATSLCLLFIMSIGYAAFQTNLSITVKGNFKGKINAAEQLISTVVTEGDGLYLDTYESDENEQRYVYKGANPNNYIKFNDSDIIWRIVSIEKDKSLKVISNDSVDTFTRYGSTNSWETSLLKNKLNTTFYDSLNDNIKNLIQEHAWGIGPVEKNNENLSEQIVSENSVTWTGNIGIISASDFIRANTNMTECGTMKLQTDNYNTDICRLTNYMASGHAFYTISPVKGTNNMVFQKRGWYPLTSNVGGYLNEMTTTVQDGMYNKAALYLIPEINLEGEGTEEIPYTIVPN